jgi:CRP/FNR family transcriptional regulator, cyclic AMP receptor protein
MSILRSFDRSPAKVFAEGALLITEGGAPGSLFILESGAVEVLRQGMVVATIDEPGAIIGEMSVLLDAPHSASVRAKTAVFAHVVENAADALRKRPELTYKVAQILARRLGATTAFLVDSREKLEDTADLDFLEKVYDLLGK